MKLPTFIEKLIDPEKRNGIGAVAPSSKFLAEEMVTERDLYLADVIVELGAGDGVFTDRIFKLAKSDAQIFILEIEPDLYQKLIEKFPEHTDSIYLYDALKLPELLASKGIETVDLFISGLPFVSLPKKFFVEIMQVVGGVSHIRTIFKQFTYIALSKDDIERNLAKYRKYFDLVIKEREYINTPPAFVLTCLGFNRKIGSLIGIPEQNRFAAGIGKIRKGIDEVKSRIKDPL